MPIFKRRIFTRKVIYRLFQLNVGTFQKCKNAHACALRDCLGVSRPFVSDTSPKCIDREGLERRRTGTRQGLSGLQSNKPGVTPVIGTMEVSLKIFTIRLWSNFPMKNTVVSKESTLTVNCYRKVIKINKKEQGSQNTSLRHARCYLRPAGRMAINYYSLSSCSQEIWNPFQ